MFLHSDFDAMYFGYTVTTKYNVISIHEMEGGVLTKNKNFTEVGAASARGRETKSLGLY